MCVGSALAIPRELIVRLLFFCIANVRCAVFYSRGQLCKGDLGVGEGYSGRKLANWLWRMRYSKLFPFKSVTHFPVCVMGTLSMPTWQVLFWMNINILRTLNF